MKQMDFMLASIFVPEFLQMLENHHLPTNQLTFIKPSLCEKETVENIKLG